MTLTTVNGFLQFCCRQPPKPQNPAGSTHQPPQPTHITCGIEQPRSAIWQRIGARSGRDSDAIPFQESIPVRSRHHLHRSRNDKAVYVKWLSGDQGHRPWRPSPYWIPGSREARERRDRELAGSQGGTRRPREARQRARGADAGSAQMRAGMSLRRRDGHALLALFPSDTDRAGARGLPPLLFLGCARPLLRRDGVVF